MLHPRINPDPSRRAPSDLDYAMFAQSLAAEAPPAFSGPRMDATGSTGGAPQPSAAPVPPLQAFRQKYPQYNDLSDRDLADRLHAKFYSDMPRAAFDARIGLASSPIVEVELPDGTIVEFPSDTPRDVMERVLRQHFGGPGSAARTPRLIPVDHDPFAPQQAQPQGPRLVPVDHDPFAPAPLPPGLPAPGTPSTPEAPGMVEGAGRQLMLGTQAVGRGAAKAVGALPDVANMAANLGLAGVDAAAQKAGVGSVPFRFGSVSDRIIEGGSALAEAAGVPLQEPTTFREKALGNAIDLGTQATFGASALTRAAAARAGTLAKPEAAPQLGDTLLRPYLGNAAKAATGDAIAGGGAGIGLTASQELVPAEVREKAGGLAGVLLDLGAMLTGGVGAATGVELATKTPSTVGAVLRERLPARDVPYDPQTGKATTNRQADAAARVAQSNAIDPERAAASVRASADEFRGMGAPMPTTGALSNDPKLMALERAVRSRHPGEFAAKDIALRDAALDTVEGIRPQRVDPRDATAYFKETVDAKSGAAAQGLRSAEGNLAAAEAGERSIADTFRTYADRGAPASETLDRAVVDKTYIPARSAKNEAFDSIDPDRTRMVDATPVVEAARRVREQVNALGPDRAQLPAEFVQRLERIAPEVQEQTIATGLLDGSGRPITRTQALNAGGSGQAPLGDLVDVRKYLATAYESATKAGNFDLADNISVLRRAINDVVSRAPDAAAANRLYRDEFAPRFRAGKPHALIPLLAKASGPSELHVIPTGAKKTKKGGAAKLAALLPFFEGANWRISKLLILQGFWRNSLLASLRISRLSEKRANSVT